MPVGNTTNIISASEDGPLSWARNINVVVCHICPVLGLLSNGLVIITMIYCVNARRWSGAGRTFSAAKRMLTSTNCFIMNLAFADIVFLAHAPLQIMQSRDHDWMLGDTACTAYLLISGISQFVAAILVGLLAFDRFLCVSGNRYSCSRLRSCRNAILTSIGAWILVSISMYPIYKYAGVDEITTSFGARQKCMPFVFKEDPINLVYADYVPLSAGYLVFIRRLFLSYVSIVGFILPMIAIALFYSIIIYKVWNPRLRNKKRKKVTTTGVWVVLGYLVCWVPYWIVQWTIEMHFWSSGYGNYSTISISILVFLLFFSCSYKAIRFIGYISNSVQYINCVLNPFIYILASSQFTKTRELLWSYVREDCPSGNTTRWQGLNQNYESYRTYNSQRKISRLQRVRQVLLRKNHPEGDTVAMTEQTTNRHRLYPQLRAIND